MNYGDEGLRLPPAVERKLAMTGIVKVADLLAMNRREILALPGIGPGTILAIEGALHRAGLALAADPFAPYVCARHSAQARDAELRAFFLCRACRDDYSHLAFSDQSPEWVSGEELNGYCAHCNEWRQVRLAQWFLCGTCDRVIRSLGRSKASAKYVESRWSALDGLPAGLVLAETDAVELQPRGKRSDPSRVASPDFVASIATRPLLGFELKSGRSALPGGGIGSPMLQFQLDTTDCDDIRAAGASLGGPILLLHAQVIGRAHAPTERYMGVGLWWARPWDMLPNLLAIRRRPRETRDAAYFNTAMFKPFDDLPHYLNGTLREDLEAIRNGGMPTLYSR